VKDTQLREKISRHSLASKESTRDKEQSGQLDSVSLVGISYGSENQEDHLDEKEKGEECEPLQSGGVIIPGVSPSPEDSFVENKVLKSKKVKTEISVTKPSDIIKQVETVTTLPTSSLIEIHVEDASISKPTEVLTEEKTVEVPIGSGTIISDPTPVQKTIEEEIDEVAKINPEDKAISNTRVPEGADLCTEDLRKANSQLLCDYNIPGEGEGDIHSDENSSSKTNSPVKICLKGNFEKLSEKVKLFELPKYQSEADLEMFEKNLSTQANDSDQIIANAEEVRIVKMVEDLDKKEKIVRIIEELDKTKSMTKRRMSGEVPGPDKRSSPPKPVEAAPITNALQGLQALLKMSKMTDPSSSSTKETDSKGSEKKSGRSRNLSGNSSKSGHGDHHEVRSRRKSGSHEHKSRKDETKSRHGDHKSRHSDPPSLTRINRSALVRDRQVETHSKSLVEEQNNKKNVVEDLQAVSKIKSGHHDYYESGRSRSKFQSFQMKDIRKRLLPGSSSINTISSRASEVAKRKGKEEDEEVKVLSYRMVKPKIEEDNHERIIRKVEDPSTVQKTIKNKTESASKLNSSLEGLVEKVSRKVTEVPKVKEIIQDDIPVEEGIKGAVKPGQSSEATLNLFQKSIVKIQSQENTDNLRTPPERRKSLDLIKEELERVTSKVNDIKKKSSSREISSDDDMKVIMKDVQDMEREVDDISQETENGRRSKSKKRKHKDDKKKKKKEKYTGDIAIDSRIAKKIISRIISSDMGKSFNEVIKREVGETESTIEKLREDLRKKSSQENKSKKKNKKDKNREGKEKKKKKKDRHGDDENPRDEAIKKKKRSKERSASPPAENAVADQLNKKFEEDVSDKVPLSTIESSKNDKSPDMNSKKRKSSSPVRFYDQVPETSTLESSKSLPYDSEDKKAKKIKSDERRDHHKKKKSKKKHKRNKEKQEKEDSVESLGNNLVDNQPSAFVESKTENKERIVRKRSSSPGKDFELVLGVAEEDLLDETVSSHVAKTDILSDSVTETEVDTTIDDNDCTDNGTDISTSLIDAALEDIPTRESIAETNISNTNSGATSSANSEDDQSEDEDNLRALLLSQLSKTRCGPKAKTKKRSSNPPKAPNSKITKISWSSPPPEPVEVSSTTPAVPATSTPSYPPMGSLPVYAYAYSRTFITPAEKLLYFPNLYNRILVPLDLDSDSDSDCHSDCDTFWGEKRTNQWVSERMSYSESDPRFSQANLNLVMRARESCSPAPL